MRKRERKREECEYKEREREKKEMKQTDKQTNRFVSYLIDVFLCVCTYVFAFP